MSFLYLHIIIFISFASMTSMAVSLAASSESSASIKKMLNTMGFSNVEDHYVTPGEDTIGYVIGSKIVNNDFGEQLTLVSVAIRGGGYGSEWASNMTIGTSNEHKGFSKASGEVVAAVKAYLKKTERKYVLCILITRKKDCLALLSSIKSTKSKSKINFD